MKEITCARSKRDGIIFYSSSIPGLAVDSFTEEGQIEALAVPCSLADSADFLDNKRNNQHKNSHHKHLLLVLQIVFVVSLLVLFRNIHLFVAAIWVCLFSSSWYHLICSAIDFKFGKSKSVARFHAAEHMAINSYNNLQHVPSLEEIKNSSRFSKNCGSMHTLNISIVSFLFTLCSISGIFLQPLVYLITLALCFTFSIILLKFRLLRFLQFLFTSKPTELELKVALKGLRVYDEIEEHTKQEEIVFAVIMHDSNTFPFF